MIRCLDLTLRLTLWFLLTADLSLANIAIGVAVTLLLPRSRRMESALSDWLRVGWEILMAIPVAYWEAIEIMLRPHTQEVIQPERVKPNRTPGLIFLDIFLITFTPKTIVLNYREEGWFDVHRIERGRNRQRSSTGQTAHGDSGGQTRRHP